MILVTAATAPVGRSIVEQLAAAGAPVRALTRDPSSAGLPGGAEVVTGDLNDPGSLAAAFDGVTSVFLLAAVPGFAPAFLKAAAEAGVRRVVFQSSGAVVDGAEPQPDDIAAFHADIERQIRDSGLEWTFLRLAVASADALQWAFDVPGQLEKGDVVRGPWADAQVSPIHPADFAAAAIAALTRAEHAGRTYTVTGPRSITHAEQIALIGRAHGRALRYEELPEQEARKAISPYAPADVLFATWSRHRTSPAPVTDTIERLTGRPARPTEEWAAAYPI
ncbi:NAD(P)H-binding protein [Nonomuraea zeae]|uniref:NAD-dependent epimerase/dehydratase family protein n=1 Tax=Nonomuraea zeae TaxID=1642303 RepID=A0A5S4G6A0_9ACTN|nr:NAD(P)H-binding protein [Nonomuraea zeae]TMR28547.1 NAD-dependent epimerase/dehydratase family protein [Nonomuraea zeae]